MRARRSAAVSWALAIAAAIALGIGGLLMYAERALFSPDGFADRTAAAFGTAPVGDAVAGRLTDAAIGVSPDLIALPPIVELAARGVVRTAVIYPAPAAAGAAIASAWFRSSPPLGHGHLQGTTREESEPLGESCPLRPAIAVLRARRDIAPAGRPERA